MFLKTVIQQARIALLVKAYLRHTITPDEGIEMTRRMLAERNKNFLELLQRAVYANPRSPYLQLLRHAEISFDVIQDQLANRGLERTLEWLYDAGVYVTVEEFKGREPIQRPGLEIAIEDVDFRNDLAGPGLDASTGGSRGASSYEQRPFGRLAADAASNVTLLEASSYLNRPVAEWRQGDMYWPISYAKYGLKLTRSFSTLDFSFKALGLRKYVKDRLMRRAAALMGIPTIAPEYVPASQGIKIVRWLAEQKVKGTAALIHLHSSSALRLCQAAQDLDIDISGTVMALSGEPFTSAKAAFVAAAGVEARVNYSSTEFGTVGRGCLNPSEPDEVHLRTDKLAMIQRERRAPGGDVLGLFFTGLNTFFPKVMINLEMGDYARSFTRDCGCRIEQLGLTNHLSGIRSYEKLTTEGVTFLGGELVHLVEEVLPERFGGHVGDFQLAEEEIDGVTRLMVLVSPRLGAVDEAAIVKTILTVLSSDRLGARQRMAELWKGADVLRVVRRDPIQTGNAKVLPLQILTASRLEDGRRASASAR